MNTAMDAEIFDAPWPDVLARMQEYIELCCLARGRAPEAITVYISRRLVNQTELQPHVREFRAALPPRPACRTVLKGSNDASHRVEITYRNTRGPA
jgi:hypothetical protein